jgi:pilus assembly protein CpaE
MIVTFLGTKGGTGTTTMAVNAGAQVHRVAGRPTVLVDLKVGPGDVALLLGLRTRHTILEFLDQLPWLDPGVDLPFVVSHACGVDVLGSGDDWSRPSSRDAEQLDHALGSLSARYDFVVVDAGCAINPSTVAALQASDLVVLVANPDVPCLRNVRRLLDAARLAGVPGERLKILLNRASEYGVGSLAQIEPVLGLPIDWRVASDYRTMAAAVSSGMPVSLLRTGDLQGEFDTIARAIAGLVTIDEPAAAPREANEDAAALRRHADR